MTRLTDEQRAFANHCEAVFVEACPGAGKTRTIVERIARIAASLPPRRGIAVLSFTNTAVEEFVNQCRGAGLDRVLMHPGFVGTFDAFLRQFFFSPGGIEGVGLRPTVVDSWESLGIEIRLRGPNVFRGPGVSLDRFDAETNRIDPASIQHNGLRAHVRGHQAAYQKRAESRRQALRENGYVSAEDVRVDLVRRLLRPGWSAALGRALASRFAEVIVDEAQDCNPLDCRIVEWLRVHRIAVTVVADPDQAIYGFRHGSPLDLRTLSRSYAPRDRLTLTGNFRSSPPICGVAATLRTRATPDTSLGETATIAEPVHVLAYHGALVPASIGRTFLELMTAAGVARQDGIVLAHARRNALRACGLGAEEEPGDSHVARIAQAVGMLWSRSGSNRVRETALRTVEWALLDLMGRIDEGEVPSRAAERRGLDPRWLRRSALQLVTRLPRTCSDSNDSRAAWVTALRDGTLRLPITPRDGMSVPRYFRSRADADWQRLLGAHDASDVRSATIHEAKGRQYDAVCVVFPPDRPPTRRTDHLFTCWENRKDDEAKRVVYVGITRARKLGVIAVPAPFSDRLAAILRAAEANWQLHGL